MEAALAYAERGWRVFPLHTVDQDGACSCGDDDCHSPAKHPRTRNGVKDATTDEAVIRRWWSKWATANVGVATGDGLGVVDVDPRSDGNSTLDRLEHLHDDLPRSVVVSTGGGGCHIYLTVPDNTRS